MAGIKEPLADVLAKLKTLQLTNGDGNTVAAHVRVWNNQLQLNKEGKVADFPKPALFVEIINGVSFQQIGAGFRSADLGFNIHIIHEFYDAQDGTMEQDLEVFDIRDKVVAMLSNHKPTACGLMVSTGEEMDYDHDNLYHYVISFVCDFTDSKGSLYDPAAGNYTETTGEEGIVPAVTVTKTDDEKIVFTPKTYQPKERPRVESITTIQF